LMTDRRSGQRLLPKACYELRIIADQIGQDDLDRVQCFEICVTRFVNDAHAALAETAVQMILTFEHGRAIDGMRRRHAIVRTCTYIVRKAEFTKLTLSHLSAQTNTKAARGFDHAFIKTVQG
jgi:hypothetical protein